MSECSRNPEQYVIASKQASNTIPPKETTLQTEMTTRQTLIMRINSSADTSAPARTRRKSVVCQCTANIALALRTKGFNKEVYKQYCVSSVLTQT